MLALHDVGEVGDAWLGRRGRGRGGSRDGRPAGQRGEVSRGVVDGLLGRMGQVALQDGACNVCISLTTTMIFQLCSLCHTTCTCSWLTVHICVGERWSR